MCGIVGLIQSPSNPLPLATAQRILDSLLLLSQSRGKDSSGLARIEPHSMIVVKDWVSAKNLLKSPEYQQLFRDNNNPVIGFIGQARMETNGAFNKGENNQPVIKDNCLVVHNGIIVNDGELWRKHSELKRNFEVDTEIINSLLAKFLREGHSLSAAISFVSQELRGSFSIGVALADYNQTLLATNNGSLYTLSENSGQFIVFASEKDFLESLMHNELVTLKENMTLEKITAGHAWIIDNSTLEVTRVDMHHHNDAANTKNALSKLAVARTIKLVTPAISQRNTYVRANNSTQRAAIETAVNQEFAKIRPVIKNLRRCTKCILPETMPYIRFDEKGVCSYCHRYIPRVVQGEAALKQELAKYHFKHLKDADCLVSFSGGRDSSYALHYIKKVLGLNPVAYSYDWGMLTELGRRNQARMTGALGVEHVLVSADIQLKRANIRKNVAAWLRRPELGTVPLFMAGDKQYFYHLNRLRIEKKLDLVFYADNALEKTDFKYGFAGIDIGGVKGRKAYDIGTLNSLHLLAYYGKEFAINPGYWNSSLVDTFTAYLSSYHIPKDYFYLFRYILWDEATVERTLIDEYDWEVAADTGSTWRIGDGTAAFYNYIYYVIAGFSEHDTFRSNQIREGVIARADALQQAESGNAARLDSLIWYFDTIGLDALKAIQTVNKATKLYKV